MKQKLNFLEDLHPVIVKLTHDSIKTYQQSDMMLTVRLSLQDLNNLQYLLKLRILQDQLSLDIFSLINEIIIKKNRILYLLVFISKILNITDMLMKSIDKQTSQNEAILFSQHCASCILPVNINNTLQFFVLQAVSWTF